MKQLLAIAAILISTLSFGQSNVYFGGTRGTDTATTLNYLKTAKGLILPTLATDPNDTVLLAVDDKGMVFTIAVPDPFDPSGENLDAVLSRGGILKSTYEINQGGHNLNFANGKMILSLDTFINHGYSRFQNKAEYTSDLSPFTGTEIPDMDAVWDYTNQLESHIRASSYVQPDAQVIHNARIQSDTLISPISSFTIDDVGKVIGIPYAGTDTLSSGVGETFVSTIQEVLDDTTIIMAATPVITVPEYRSITDGVMLAGSDTLRSQTANFRAGDVGKKIIIPEVGEQTVDANNSFDYEYNQPCWILNVLNDTEVIVTRWALRYADSLNIDIPGVKAVYGSDAYEGLQAAVDTAMASNKFLLIDSGSYLITQQIVINSGLTVTGEGWGKTIVYPVGGAERISAFYANSEIDDSLEDVHFSHFEIDGFAVRSKHYSPNSKGIFIKKVNNFSVRNMFIHDVSATGIGCGFINNYIISENHVEHCGAQVLEPIRRDAARQEPRGGAGIGLGTGHATIEHGMVINNFSTDNGSYGVFFEIQSKELLTNGIYIIGNTVNWNTMGGLGDLGTSGTVYLANKSHYNKIGLDITTPFRKTPTFSSGGLYQSNELLNNKIGVRAESKGMNMKFIDNVITSDTLYKRDTGFVLLVDDTTGFTYTTVGDVELRGNTIGGYNNNVSFHQKGTTPFRSGIITNNIIFNGGSSEADRAAIFNDAGWKNLNISNNTATDYRDNKYQSYGFLNYGNIENLQVDDNNFLGNKIGEDSIGGDITMIRRGVEHRDSTMRGSVLLSYKDIRNTNDYAVIVELGGANMRGFSADSSNPNFPFKSEFGALYWNAQTLSFDTLTTTRGGSAGSMSNYFADKLYQLTGKKSIIVHYSSVNSTLDENASPSITNNHWGASGYIRDSVIARVQQALDSASTQLGVDIDTVTAVLWSQGEADAAALEVSPYNYSVHDATVAMDNVFTWIKSSFPNTPIFISELGSILNNVNYGTSNSAGWTEIREQQDKQLQKDNVYMGYSGAKYFTDLNNYKMLTTTYYRYTGLKLMGEALASAVSKVYQNINVNGVEIFDEYKEQGLPYYLALNGSTKNTLSNFRGDLDSIKNTSVVHCGITQLHTPPWATGNGNVCTYTAFNNNQIQYWFGKENEFGWRSHTPGLSYSPWVRVLSDVTLRDSIRGRFLATYRADGGYTELYAGHLDSVKTTAIVYSNTGGSGRPSTANENGHLMSIFQNVKVGKQLYFPASTSEMYIRNFTDSSFSVWRRFWSDADFTSANVTFWNDNTSAKESILIDGNTTTTVTYTLPSSATWAQVQPSNAAAGTAQVNYVEVSGTTLTIHTNNATPSGTNNLSYNIQFK